MLSDNQLNARADAASAPANDGLTDEELAAQYGAQDVVDPGEDLSQIMTEAGITEEEPVDPNTPLTDEQLAEQYGAVDYVDDTLPAGAQIDQPGDTVNGDLAPLNSSKPDETPKSKYQRDTERLFKEKEVLRKEGLKILNEMDPNNPEGDVIRQDFADRWVEQLKRLREQELAGRITFDGELDPNHRQKSMFWRRGEEGIQRFAGTFAVALARGLGREQRALDMTRAMDDLSEYNRLIDRNSFLGKTMGPVFGEIAAGLTQTTASASTGGMLGIASTAAIDKFNQNMEEGETQGLSPVDQVTHATVGAGVMLGTTLAGGMFASKLNVASGETIIPLVSRISSSLFTKTGLTKMAVAAGVEGGEEGIQTIADAIESIRSGVNTDAFSTLYNDFLTNFSTGAFVGTITQAGESAGSFAGAAGAKVAHHKDLMTSWGNRLRKKGEGADAAKVRKPGKKSRPKLEQGQKGRRDTDQSGERINITEKGHVVTPDNQIISKSSLNEELEALVILEQEIDAAFEDGGAKDLRNLINEREADVDGTAKDIRELERERSKQIQMFGSRLASPRVRNTDGRLKILKKYQKEIKHKTNASKAELATWKKEYNTIHASEKAFIANEYKRLEGLRELPDVGIDILDNLTKPNEVASRKKGGAKKPVKQTPEQTQETALTEGGMKVVSRKVVDGREVIEVEQMTAEEKAAAKDARVKEKAAQEKQSKDNKAKGGDNQVDKSKLIIDGLHKDMNKADQQSQKRVREFMKMDELEARKSISGEFAFQEANRRGLPKKAREYAAKSLQDGRIMDETELAGVQSRYVDVLTRIREGIEWMTNNTEANENTINAREALIKDQIDEVDMLTEAWIASSSKAGAALQAQQRVYGVVYGLERAMVLGRRNKGSELTIDEVKRLTRVIDDVKVATDNLAKIDDKTSEEHVKADFALQQARMEHHAALWNLRKGKFLEDNIEAWNAARMGMTLSGDFIPIGRQGYVRAVSHPIDSWKSQGAFWKPFFNKKVADSELAAFRQERKLREMKNYHTLTKQYGIPQVDRHTKFSEIETSSVARVRRQLQRLPKLGKHFKSMQGSQFDLAYRTWLNTQRMEVADAAFEANKHLLDLPGGKDEMQMVLDNMMNSTGHSKRSFGTLGNTLLVAPRWFISRLAYPAKAFKHIPRGILGTIQNKPNGSQFLAREYGRAMVGAAVMATSLHALTTVLFGEENSDMDYNPFSKTFGLLTVNGVQYDLTGGMGTFSRGASKAVQGAFELLNGPDDVQDFDFGQTIGGMLGNRASPIVRDIAYAFQAGKPMGSREKQGFGEYVLRNMTPLSWQALSDGMQADGIGTGMSMFAMEMFGFTAFEKAEERHGRKVKFH